MKRATALAFAALIAAVWVAVRSGVSAAPPSAATEQPYQVELVGTISASSGPNPQGTVAFTVPAGKTLTLEYFSSSLDHQSPLIGAESHWITTTLNGVTATHAVAPSTTTGQSNGTIFWGKVTGQSLRLYASGGTTVTVTSIYAGATGQVSADFTTTISGTLK